MTFKLTERQEEILNMVIKEYVQGAEPVSSQELLKKHDFGVSPATIRSELQKLTDKGYLSQPHTSAGRVPTDRGYRFFVNGLMNKEKPASAPEELRRGKEGVSDGLALAGWKGDDAEDTFRFIQNLTRHLAEESRALALNYLEGDNLFWKEGWEELLLEPEFEERDNILNFTCLLKNFEEHIEELEKSPGVNICIGKENPFPKAKDFTVISSHYRLPSGEGGIISILGPKRMEYDRNIGLINSLMKLFDNF